MGKFFMKKVMPVVLIIAMLFSMTMTSFAVEAAEPTVSMTASEIADGKFTVTVSVANNPGIDSFAWKLGYDSNLVTPVYDADTFWGDVVSGGTLETNLADAEYTNGTAITAVFAKEDGTTADGTVFAVDFALTAQAYNADITFTLDIDDTVTSGTFADVADLTVKGPLAAVSFSSVEVTSVDADRVTISWDIVTTEAAHDVFVVLRDGEEIATLTTEDRSFTDSGLTEGTEYVYQVKCGDVLSAEVTVKTVSKAEKASTITLIPGGTNKSETINWEYTTYTLPEGTDYVRNGYTFAGWTADEGKTILEAGSEYAVTGNVVLQAVWKKVAATPTTWVYYNPGEVVDTISYNYTSQVKLGRNNGGYFFTQFPAIEDTDFLKASFQFYGLQKAGYCYLNLYPVTSANFTKAFGEYLITDNVNATGIELDPEKFVFPTLETRIYISSSQLAATTSNSWLPEHDITSFVKANANGFILASSLTSGNSTADGLRMEGTKARIVTYHLPEAEDTTGRAVVTFDANGGKGSITRIVTDPGSEITLPSEGVTLQSNTLAGWTNGKTTYALGAKVTVDADTTFKAVWEYQGGEVTLTPVATYHVSVPSTGDPVVKEATGQVYMASGTASDPAGNYYIYNVYDLSGFRNVKSAVINKTVNKITRSSTTHFAPVTSVWPDVLTDAELADITVGDNIASAALSSSNNKVDGAYVAFTDTFDITDFVKTYEGDTLVIREWATNWDYSYAADKRGGSADTYSPKAADTITLVTGTEYQVSFDANGGEGTLPETTFGTLTLPECELTNGDLAFVGWSDGSKVYSAGTEYTPKKDTVLKATWGNGVTITLDDNGTKTTETVGAGGEITLPEGAATTNVGTLTFVGWNYAGTVYAAGTKVKADISKTYTAVYTYVGGEGDLAWVESWYFGTSENGAATGTLTKDPTGQKNIFRQFDTSAYFAKIDISGLRNVKSAILKVNHVKHNNQATAVVYDLTEAAYNAAFANAVTGTFNTADLPTGTSVASKVFATTAADNAGIIDEIDITEYIASKVASGAKYAYIRLHSTATGSSTQDHWRVKDFSTKSYVSVSTATKYDVTFDMGADAIVAEAGETITLPACTAINGTLTFDGWTDGETVYAAGAEYVVNGNVSFTATWKETAKVMYTYSGELLSEVTPEAGAEITLPAADAYDFGAFTLSGWSDGTTTYEPGAAYTFAGDKVVVFDAIVTFAGGGESTVEFDLKSLLEMGKYDTTTAAYDNTVKTRKDNVTGTAVTVNARMTKGTEGYRVRPYVYVSVDLSDAVLADNVLLNITAARSGSASDNSIQVKAVDGIPAVGDAFVTGSAVGSLTLSTTPMTGTVDITEAYNAAVGKTLYLQVYGWAYANDKAGNYVTLNVDSLNMTVTVPSGTPVMFDQGAASRVEEAGSTITLPEFTGKAPAGKAFAGWSDGTTTYEAGAEYVVPATSVTLKAQFADGVTLTVVGENNETKEYSYIAGEITLPDAEFTKAGYTFYGYATANKAIYAIGDAITLEEDTVLTAVFTKKLAIDDWYLYYGSNGTVTNHNQKSHTLGRNNGSILFTSVDISSLDSELVKATFGWTSRQQKAGYTYFTAYPVTGSYATTFAGIERNTTTTEAVDISGLVLGEEIGRTAKNVDAYIATTDYSQAEYTISNLGTYFNNQYEDGNTKLQLAYKLNGGDANTDGLRMYNSTAYPAYMVAYVLAGARELVEYVPEVPVEPSATIDTFTVTATSDTQVDLAWTATLENAEGAEYVIYKDWEQLATTTETSYVDNAVEAETTYTYQVAVKLGDEEIAWSDEIEVTTPAEVIVPAEPVTTIDSFTAEYNEETNGVVMTWTATAENVDGEVSYMIYKDWEQYGTISDLTYTDTEVAPETLYVYQVAMMVDGEEVAWSDEIEVTTPAAPVVVPNVSVNTVEVTNVTYESATVTWTATVENAEVTYDVVVNGEAVVKGITETTYALTGLDAETAYTVEIRANYGEEYAAKSTEFTTAKAPVAVDGTSPKVVLCNDSYYRYYPNGVDADPATGMWLLDGYIYYFSTSASKYGAAQVNTTVRLTGVTFTFNEYGVATAQENTALSLKVPTVEIADLASAVTDSSVTLTWNANATNAVVTGFNIYRDGSLLDTVDANIDSTAINGAFLTGKGWTFTPVTGAFTYTDDTAFQNTTYTYEVEAIFEGGEGKAEITALTDAYASRYVTYDEATGYWKYYKDGVVQTGWQTTPDGYRYYFSGSASKLGAAMTGKNMKVGSSYYDFTDYGALINSYDEDGNPVLFFELNGFSTDDEGITRYYDKNVYRTGWQFIDGYKYYFSTADGKMLTGSMRVGSIYYLFDETDGHWIGYYQTPYTVDESPKATDVNVCEDGFYRYYPNGTDADPMAGQWKVLPGADGYYKYYFSSSASKYGAAITGYEIQVGGAFYNFYPTGALMSVDVLEDGSAYMHPYKLSLEQGAKNGICLDDDGEYRYYIDGEYQIGVLEVDGYKYIFRTADGSAVTSADHTADGYYKRGAYNYVLDETGKILSKTLRK